MKPKLRWRKSNTNLGGELTYDGIEANRVCKVIELYSHALFVELTFTERDWLKEHASFRPNGESRYPIFARLASIADFHRSIQVFRP